MYRYLKSLTFVKISLGLTILILVACSNSGSIKSHAGYADIDYPKFWQAKEETSFSIGPGLLKLAGWAMSQEEDSDKAEKELIKNLKSVRIKTYRLEGEQLVGVTEKIRLTAAELENQGWMNIISVVEENSRTSILLKQEENLIQGLVILTADVEEAVFINLVGQINLETLMELAREGESESIGGLFKAG